MPPQDKSSWNIVKQEVVKEEQHCKAKFWLNMSENILKKSKYMY